MTHYVIEGGVFQLAFQAMPAEWFLPFTCGERSDRRPTGKGSDPSKTRYTCPSCRARVWGKPHLSIICTPCLVAARESGQPVESAVFLAA